MGVKFNETNLLAAKVDIDHILTANLLVSIVSCSGSKYKYWQKT